MLTIGSLFSGIGGLELGLERATGARTVWQVERDPFCLRVLTRHWPDAKRYNNVETAKDLPRVDIMCGGFPCQDISTAGRGGGIQGARSGLWREFARLIGEGRPRVVVVENVPALASRGLAVVLRDLDALGYVGSWNVVSAASVGAPHLRRRLFIVAADADCVELRQQSEWHQGWINAIQRSREAIPVVDGDEWPFAEWNEGGHPPEVRRVDAGLFAGMDGPGGPRSLDAERLRALGNAVVPHVAEVVGRVVAQVISDLPSP